MRVSQNSLVLSMHTSSTKSGLKPCYPLPSAHTHTHQQTSQANPSPHCHDILYLRTTKYNTTLPKTRPTLHLSTYQITHDTTIPEEHIRTQKRDRLSKKKKKKKWKQYKQRNKNGGGRGRGRWEVLLSMIKKNC